MHVRLCKNDFSLVICFIIILHKCYRCGFILLITLCYQFNPQFVLHTNVSHVWRGHTTDASVSEFAGNVPVRHFIKFGGRPVG